jgi:hypothetical protein
MAGVQVHTCCGVNNDSLDLTLFQVCDNEILYDIINMNKTIRHGNIRFQSRRPHSFNPIADTIIQKQEERMLVA